MTHHERQQLINGVQGNYFKFAADQEARYRKEVMELEDDCVCQNCKKRSELVDGICWSCISEMEGNKS